MEISIYSTIDFSKARNLLTERQKKVKAFNPIVPVGGCISLLELNPLQYSSIDWTLINEKTGKITEATAESSDAMHYVAIPEGLRLGTYKLKIVTSRTVGVDLIVETTISNPFEYVEASEDIITIVSRNLENDLVGNVPPNATILQPIYTHPLKIVDLADVDDADIADDKILVVNEISPGVFVHVYENKPTGGGGGFIQQALTDGASIAWNVANGNYGTVTFGGNRTISNPSNFAVGQELIIEITQDGTGTRLATWDSYFTFSGGVVPILSAGAGDVDRLRFIARSATVLSFEGANFDI